MHWQPGWKCVDASGADSCNTNVLYRGTAYPYPVLLPSIRTLVIADCFFLNCLQRIDRGTDFLEQRLRALGIYARIKLSIGFLLRRG
jgi:hypothetical protein